MTGRIHSMESFGTVDGPGIRFVVFLQGCRWRCRYCHNPDTWRLDGGTEMDSASLHDTLLRYRAWYDSSGGGVTVSGGEPLLQSAFVTDLFTRLKASGIHTCLDTNGDWPEQAQPAPEEEVVHLTPEEGTVHLTPEEGTVHLTPEEEAVHPTPEEGTVHPAPYARQGTPAQWKSSVQPALHVQNPALDALLAVTDLVLLDIKHPDPETHRSLTGAEAGPTLRFLERLCEKSVETWLRYVVVPGWTDSPDAITAIRHLKESYSNVSDIQWLPYHRMGIYKWNELDIPYSLNEVPAADEKLMERIRNGQI